MYALVTVAVIITLGVSVLLVISQEKKNDVDEKHRKTWNIIYYVSTGYLGLMAALGTLVSIHRRVISSC